ncbi:MAG: hypothetical protein ABJA78_18120 [Ferruginibacter sp.]
MKGQVMPSCIEMATEELQDLTAETKETVATQQANENRKFGSVDLWNRQRQMKQASGFLRKWQYN